MITAFRVRTYGFEFSVNKGVIMWNFVFGVASKVKRCGEDNHDGCGCLKPKKIKKEGLASLYAEWEEIEGISQEEKDKLSINQKDTVLLYMAHYDRTYGTNKFLTDKVSEVVS